jgi:heat shock protein HslJ
MKKISSSCLTLLTALAWILSACAAAGGSASLAGTPWKLVSYGPKGEQIPAVTGVQTNVDFGTDGHVSGNVGCNPFGGSYKVSARKITFSEIFSTEIACQEPRNTQERQVFQVMKGTVRFELLGNSIVIFSTDEASTITLAR